MSVQSPSITAPFDAPSTALSAAQRGAILAQSADATPVLIVICRKADLGIVYVNGPAGLRLDPSHNHDLTSLALSDLVGVGSTVLLKNEMLVQANVLGKWSGHFVLRDTWGSEFPVSAALTHQAPEAGSHEAFLCLQAIEQPNFGSKHGTSTSDHELLHALMETVPDTIYFKDLNSRFLRVSRSLAKKDGVNDPAKLIGLTDFDRFTIEHAQPAFDDEQRIIHSGRPMIDVEEKETWPDGRVTWVSTTKLPLHDTGGQIVGTFGISRDITARKAAEQAHNELLIQSQLPHKLEAIGRLAAGVAHEINTPTQFITNNAQFLSQSFAQLARLIETYQFLQEAAAQHPPLAAQARTATALAAEIELPYLLSEIPQALTQSLEGLAQITRIVGALREFSHPTNVERTSADLNRAIETAVTVSHHQWKYLADVVTDLDPDLPKVPCAVDEFNQAILNLLINATHAIESALKTRGDGSERGTITIRTRRDGEWALIEVADTGTGMTDAVRSRLFEPFFTTKEIGKGTGQGLTIVHTVIVRHHQGTINLTTEVGRGSTFHLRLPLNPPPKTT